MQFFKFSPNTFQWDVNLYSNEDYKDTIVPMNENRWIKEEILPLKMRLIDAFENLDAWKGESLFVDVLRWYTNLATGDVEPDEGASMIMSKKVKEVIEKYRLPEHRFYPVLLYCKELKQSSDDYFLFHITVDNPLIGEDIIDYPKSTFVEVTEDIEGNKILVNNYPEGIIKSIAERDDLRRNTIGTYTIKYGSKELTFKNKLEFENKVYKYDYDVLWGLSNTLYISEEIKKELEAVSITNGSFFELKENMIRPFEYEQMKNS